MSVRGRLIAAVYDRLTAASEREGLAARRHELLSAARGRVLEIGAGTGLNLEHYPDSIAELLLAEPERAMARRLAHRLETFSRPARIVNATAEALPFQSASVDVVVCTLVLCSVDDPPRAISELSRVLQPGGLLLFLEHVRSDDPRTARRQDRINPVWRFIANGCNCNRTTLSLIERSFAVDEIERGDVPKAPSFVRPLVSGRAIAG